MTEDQIRLDVVRWGKSLFDRGLTAGSSGNISVRLDDGFITTPTNSCLGFLDTDRLSRLDAGRRHVRGDPPTKELPLHFGLYDARPHAKAVVHLHSTFATAISCLVDSDPANAIPPITPYAVMRLGRVPIIPYTRPGALEAGPLVAALAVQHSAILMQNHGPIVAGTSLDAAVFAMEELEETAKLLLLTRGVLTRVLDADAVAELEHYFRLL